MELSAHEIKTGLYNQIIGFPKNTATPEGLLLYGAGSWLQGQLSGSALINVALAPIKGILDAILSVPGFFKKLALDAAKKIIDHLTTDNCIAMQGQFKINHKQTLTGARVRSKYGMFGTVTIVYNKSNREVLMLVQGIAFNDKKIATPLILLFGKFNAKKHASIAYKPLPWTSSTNDKTKWRIRKSGSEVILEVIGLDNKDMQGKVKVNFYDDESIDDHLYFQDEKGEKVYEIVAYVKNGILRRANKSVAGKPGIPLTGKKFYGGWEWNYEFFPTITHIDKESDVVSTWTPEDYLQVSYKMNTFSKTSSWVK